MQINYRTTKPLLHYGILILMYAVAIVTLVSHTVLHAQAPHGHNEGQAAKIDPCKGEFMRHELVFADSGVAPQELSVKRCDTIVVRNSSARQVELAIGSHPKHVRYPGFKETSIMQGGAATFRATQTGMYTVHDHDNPILKAELTVEE